MITFNKSAISILVGACSLSLASSVLAAAPPSSPFSGFYVGGFGGGGSLNNFQIRQSGIALFSPTLNAEEIGSLSEPLAIDATGSSDTNSIGFGGIHLGYEWNMPMYKDSWSLTPAIELEGLYTSNKFESDLDNSSIILTEHDFDVSFPTKTGVVLVNTIFEVNGLLPFNTLHPYIGVGLGAAILSITGANSPQVSPPEPNVNHFNSDEDSLDWTFAAQAKAGLRYAFNDHWRVFAEYRFLYLGNTDFTFGSTNYPTHVPTTSWQVGFDNMYSNAGAMGIEFSA